jgi:transcriptional regulator GlxA family with amidase domain
LISLHNQVFGERQIVAKSVDVANLVVIRLPGRMAEIVGRMAFAPRFLQSQTSSMTRIQIGILGFDGVQALDVVGPADAFAAALTNTDSPAPERLYDVTVIGLTGRRLVSEGGLVIQADATIQNAPRIDTLIIPGGSGLRMPAASERASKWIFSRASRIRRIASVCTGIYGLAPTGLLDGRRVTTHWAFAQDAARRFPKLHFDPDALFIRDGSFYTSAGITAGIDLSLAMIEEDHGPGVALAVARELVVFVKRPGGQNQFSEPLRFQSESADRFSDLAAWIAMNLRSDLSVEVLAARVFLSSRQFSRAFKTEFQTTPAAFVEETRLAEASRRLSSRRATVDMVARSVGYPTIDTFRRAFERRYGVTPTDYRRRFS